LRSDVQAGKRGKRGGNRVGALSTLLRITSRLKGYAHNRLGASVGRTRLKKPELNFLADRVSLTRGYEVKEAQIVESILHNSERARRIDSRGVERKEKLVARDPSGGRGL